MRDGVGGREECDEQLNEGADGATAGREGPLYQSVVIGLRPSYRRSGKLYLCLFVSCLWHGNDP